MITNPTQSKRLQCYIVLAALTCVSASTSTVEPKTTVTGVSASQHPLGVVGESDARVKRNLRTNLDTENMGDDNQDRGWQKLFDCIIGAKVEKVPAISVPRNTQEATDQRFRDLMGIENEFDKNTKDLLQNGKFTEWSKSVDEAYKDPVKAAGAKITTLLTIYRKDYVMTMLAAKKTVQSARDISRELKISLLKKWAADDEHVDDVIHLLDPGENTMVVLANRLLKVWIHNKQRSIKDKKPYRLLLTQFATRHSDKELAELFFKARKNIASQDVAIELAKVQLENWKERGVRVTRSFKLFKLNEVDLTELLRSPMLSTWIVYVKMLGVDPYQVLFLAMRKRVGDRKLDSILAAAKTDGTDESIWRILLHKQEKHQVEEWWTAQKTPDDVFDLLKLKEKGDMVFESPEFKSWALYVKKLSSISSRNGDVELAHQLFRHYDSDVVEMLSQSRERAIAKNDEVTKEIVSSVLKVFERER